MPGSANPSRRAIMPIVRTALVTFVVGLGLALVPPAAAQSSSGAKTLRDTVSLSPNGHVDINSQRGSITVTTWARSQVAYEVTVAPGNDNAELVQDPVVNHSDRELSFGYEDTWTLEIPGLLTISPNGASDPIGHYRIVMPRTATLDINGHDSAIEVSGVRGNVTLDAHAGSITVRDVEGRARLETFSGAITATALRGRAALETYSGHITAAFDSLSGASSAETHSGDLHLFLPADAGFTLQNDADSSAVSVDDAFGAPTRTDEQWAFNGGGPVFSVDTFTGAIVVRPLSARGSSP